jgi:hypothetical protein
MQKILKLLALAFVRDDPRIGRHIGNRGLSDPVESENALDLCFIAFS